MDYGKGKGWDKGGEVWGFFFQPTGNTLSYHVNTVVGDHITGDFVRYFGSPLQLRLNVTMSNSADGAGASLNRHRHTHI